MRRFIINIAMGLAIVASLAGQGCAQGLPQPLAKAVEAGPTPGWRDLDQALDALLPGPSSAEAPDLFGLTTVRLQHTIYDRVWGEVLSSPMPRGNNELDAEVARLSAMPLGERVQAANAWINARIPYGPDPDITSRHWGALGKTLAEGRGEREDIAIAKLQLLSAAGTPRTSMFLVLVADWRKVADDALLAVRDGDQVYLLGNHQDDVLDPHHTDRYWPLVALGAEGNWVFGRRMANTQR